MCGRFTETIDPRTMIERFGLTTGMEDIMIRFNIAPTQDVPVVVIRDGARALVPMRWGLVPHWAKDASIGARMINARAETVHEKPSFRKSLVERRCLVPADGFYEWMRKDGQSAKIPVRIVLKSREMFAFAGLWDVWRAPDADAPLHSFTIVTTESNELIRPFHERMPVILPRRDEERWLDPALTDIEELRTMLRPFPADLMEMYVVSAKVNSPRNESPLCIEPASSPGAPE
jgi:putative SOS response-associated peptidase YedK